MTTEAGLDLTSLETYSRSCLEIAADKLRGFDSLADAAGAVDDINQYPRLQKLEDPRDVLILEQGSVDSGDMEAAIRAVLDGRVLWEHTAAGEATRLKLGTKYLIHPRLDLFPLEKIADRYKAELGRKVSVEEVLQLIEVQPDRLFSINLGNRHLLQLAFDVFRLAKRYNADPLEVMARQRSLIILNENTADQIVDQIAQADFFGFARENVLFMVQSSFYGIGKEDNHCYYDRNSPRRLHNHGQMVMQETMDDQIFYIDGKSQKIFLSGGDFSAILSGMLDKISYNIEDLDYMTRAIDWLSLAMALKLGARGYNMVMEIVANDPAHPIKGGLAAYDGYLGRNVMIESFQLKGMPTSDINFLNKNINHYTNPQVSWRSLREHGLPMPVVVKHDRLYFQAVQGDLNFLVKTAFVRRKEIQPIRSWKSVFNTPQAISAMREQDLQDGFRDFVKNYLEGVDR